MNFVANRAAATRRNCVLARTTAMKAMPFGAALLVLALPLLVPAPANAAEHALAGIKIFASIKEVLARFGDPTQILTGADAIAGAPSGGSSSAQSNSAGPGAGMAAPVAVNRPPEFSGGGGGGGTAASSAGANTSTTAGATDDQASEVMYIYQKPSGLTMEFLASPDGRVIQISVLGYKGTVKTVRGIMLGSTYGTVVRAYGYPESQDNTSGVLTMRYLTKQHVAFQLNKNKVVGITVAAVE